MTLTKAIEAFLFHCKYEKNLTRKTQKAYTTDLEQMKAFMLDLCGEISIQEVDKHRLREYLRHLTPLAQPRTVKRKVATMRAFFNYLEFEDHILVSPFRKMRVKITLDHRLPEVLTLREVRDLFNHLYARARRVSIPKTPTQKLLIRDIAILEMLFTSGMRVSELCNLKMGDVDLYDGSIKIFGKGRKERLVPICDRQVIASLEKYQQVCQPDLAGNFFHGRAGARLSEQTVRVLVDKHVIDAGITKKVTPHTFRHTVATLLLENGMDIRNIQMLLGHSTITTTQIYVKVNMNAQRELLGRIHPGLSIERYPQLVDALPN